MEQLLSLPSRPERFDATRIINLIVYVNTHAPRWRIASSWTRRLPSGKIGAAASPGMKKSSRQSFRRRVIKSYAP